MTPAEIYYTFPTEKQAKATLTLVRKKYRVAFRGAVACRCYHPEGYRLHVPLGGTGFSAAELASVLEWEVRNGDSH